VVLRAIETCTTLFTDLLILLFKLSFVQSFSGRDQFVTIARGYGGLFSRTFVFNFPFLPLLSPGHFTFIFVRPGVKTNKKSPWPDSGPTWTLFQAFSFLPFSAPLIASIFLMRGGQVMSLSGLSCVAISLSRSPQLKVLFSLSRPQSPLFSFYGLFSQPLFSFTKRPRDLRAALCFVRTESPARTLFTNLPISFKSFLPLFSNPPFSSV